MRHMRPCSPSQKGSTCCHEHSVEPETVPGQLRTKISKGTDHLMAVMDQLDFWGFLKQSYMCKRRVKLIEPKSSKRPVD